MCLWTNRLTNEQMEWSSSYRPTVTFGDAGIYSVFQVSLSTKIYFMLFLFSVPLLSKDCINIALQISTVNLFDFVCCTCIYIFPEVLSVFMVFQYPFNFVVLNARPLEIQV